MTRPHLPGWSPRIEKSSRRGSLCATTTTTRLTASTPQSLTLLERRDLGLTLPHVIITTDGRVAGRITLDGISRGAFQSCTVGYWVSTDQAGQGLASSALAEVCQIAFNELGLHRIEAGTLLHNARSQRVLAKNAFAQYGKAPDYVKIAGRWQDHLLFQRLTLVP